MTEITNEQNAVFVQSPPPLLDLSQQSMEEGAIGGSDDPSMLSINDKLSRLLAVNQDALAALVKLHVDTTAISKWVSGLGRGLHVVDAGVASSHNHSITPPNLNPKPKQILMDMTTPRATVAVSKQGPATQGQSSIMIKPESPPEEARHRPQPQNQKDVGPLDKPVGPPQVANQKKQRSSIPDNLGQDTGKHTVVTTSEKTLEMHREDKEHAKERNGMMQGLRAVIGGVGAKGVGAIANATRNSDVRDVIGSSLGGPLWDVIQEVREVTDTIDMSRVKNAKDWVQSKRTGLPPGMKRDKAGRIRNSQGQYIQTEHVAATPQAPAKETKAMVRDKKMASDIGAQTCITKDIAETEIQMTKSMEDMQKDQEATVNPVKRMDATLKKVAESGGPLNLASRGSRVATKKSKDTAKRQKGGVVRSEARQKTLEDHSMLKRNRPKGSIGTIRTPRTETTEIKEPSGLFRKRGGKFGKIAGMLSAGVGITGVGGGLLGGLLGSDDSHLDTMSDVASTAATKSSGILSSTKTAATTATQGASKLGVKGAAKLGMKGASLGLRALGPLATIGLAGYDAFEGWNDKDLHASAFGLKEGQEATTGQKASSALANMVDMGGLGTGLLRMLGVDAETSDIARGVHGAGSWLGEALGLLPGEKNQKGHTAVAKSITDGAPVAERGVHPTATTILRDKHAVDPMSLPGQDEGANHADTIKLTRSIDELTKAVDTMKGGGANHYVGGKPMQQPVTPKSNIGTDFDDTMLTLIAYDRL
jgi:hypothetical protein